MTSWIDFLSDLSHRTRETCTLQAIYRMYEIKCPWRDESVSVIPFEVRNINFTDCSKFLFIFTDPSHFMSVAYSPKNLFTFGCIPHSAFPLDLRWNSPNAKGKGGGYRNFFSKFRSTIRHALSWAVTGWSTIGMQQVQ